MNLDLQKVLPAEAFETEQNEGDYIGKDGLLYCGVCRTKKQTRLPASDFTGGREIIVPCICKCKVEENKRKEEEEKKKKANRVAGSVARSAAGTVGRELGNSPGRIPG